MGAPTGNQNAAKAKRWSAAIERAMQRKAGEGLRENQEALDAFADKFVEAVLAGEPGPMTGWKELGDRLEGKPAQVIQGDPDAPLQTRLVIGG